MSCKRSIELPPQAAFDEVEAEIRRGDLPLAQRTAHTAGERFSEKNDLWMWKFRILEAQALVLRGRSSDVIGLLQEPLPQQFSQGDMEIQRDILMAIAYGQLGKDALADQAVVHAQFLVDATHSSLDAELLRARGVAYVHRGELQHADLLFRQALDLSRKRGDRFLEATILLNIGVVELGNEHYDEALYWCHGATEIATAIHAQLILEKALANEGWAYYELGDYERSLANSNAAVIQAEHLGSAVDQVRWLNNAGQAMYQLQDLKNAEVTYEKSLAIAESIENKLLMANAHVALAFLLIESGQDDAATIHVDQSLAAAQAQGNEAAQLPLLLARALIAFHQSRADAASQILQGIYKSPALTPSLRWEVEDAFANLNAKQGRVSDAEQWYRKSIATFERQRFSLRNDESKLPFSGNAKHLYRDYIGFLIRSGKTVQALQVLDRGRARTLEEGLRSGQRKATKASGGHESSKSFIINPRAVAHSIDGTVLEYSLGPGHSYLWVSTSKTVRLFELPAEADIDARVKQYQLEIANSNDVLAKRSEAGMWLYKNLVAPASALLPASAKVYVIPDGSLNHVNFETFLVPEPTPHFWLEDVILTTADSLQMLRNFHSRASLPRNSTLLLIGNPMSPADDFADLPNAPEEVASVSGHFAIANRTVLTRAAASPASYSASGPDRFSYIHFVAHGVASQLSPLDSAVLLSRTSDHPENFKLYARDIVRLPIKAELVTVSTCFGSGTKSYAGEGLVGLSWAFLRAGSHNVIGAMWAVSDASTPRLMDHLYDSLMKGAMPNVALRNAKLSLAHSKGVYRKPLYWGAFQLYSGA